MLPADPLATLAFVCNWDGVSAEQRERGAPETPREDATDSGETKDEVEEVLETPNEGNNPRPKEATTMMKMAATAKTPNRSPGLRLGAGAEPGSAETMGIVLE